MEILLEKTDSLTALVKVTLNEADYQDRVEKKIKEYARTVQIKGFRPGKVPPNIIRKLFGKSIKASEVSYASLEAAENYLRENKIAIMGGLLPSQHVQNQEYDWENQTRFEFAYDIGLRPEVKPVVDKSIVIHKPSADITEEKLDAFIEKIRRMYAEEEHLEEIIDNPDIIISGTLVVAEGEDPIRLPKFDDPNATFDIFSEKNQGLGSFSLKDIPEHKSLFLGKKQGDKVTFDLRTLFPTDEQVDNFLVINPQHVPLMKGMFTMTIREIILMKLPEVNQKFFHTVLGNDAVQSEADFRDQMRAIAEREAQILQKEHMVSQFKDRLLEANSFDLPDAFMIRWLAANNSELSQEKIAESYESYRDKMRLEMLVAELARAKDIKVEPRDVLRVLNDINFLQITRMGYLYMKGMEDTLSQRMLQDSEQKSKTNDYYRLALLHKVFDAYADAITIQEQTNAEA